LFFKHVPTNRCLLLYPALAEFVDLKGQPGNGARCCVPVDDSFRRRRVKRFGRFEQSGGSLLFGTSGNGFPYFFHRRASGGTDDPVPQRSAFGLSYPFNGGFMIWHTDLNRFGYTVKMLIMLIWIDQVNQIFL
jgi:hypothetical protein